MRRSSDGRMAAPEGSAVPDGSDFLPDSVRAALLADLALLNEDAWAARMTDPQRSAALGREAFALAEQLGDAGGVVAALRTLALQDLYGSDTRSAFDRLNRALDLLSVHPDMLLERLCKSLLGCVYQELSNSDRATALHFEALELSRLLGHPDGEATALMNLGIVAFQGLKDPVSAVSFFQRALVIQRRTGNVRAQMTALYNLTEVLVAQGMWLEARVSGEETVQGARVAGIRLFEAQALNNVARTYAGTGELLRAAQLHDEALEMVLALKLDRPSPQAYIEWHRAQNLITLLRFEEAEAALKGTLQLLAGLKQDEQIIGVHRTLAGLYRRTERFMEALTHFETAFAIKEAFDAQQAVKRTQAMMMQFDVERAQSESELYRLRTVELAGMNVQLEQAALERASLLSALQEQQVRLLQQAQEDALSGLANRRHAETLLGRAYEEHAAREAVFVVAMIDIDDFKRVNDTFSHQVGDDVIRLVGGLFRGHLRDGDVVGRYGGEEFVMMFANTDLLSARSAMERLRVKVQEYDWEAVAPGLRVTISVGGALSSGHADWEKVVGAADVKLYQAKRTKNTVAC